MNAWVRKEIRDAVRWAPIGMFVLGALLWYTLVKAKTPPTGFLQLSGSLYSLVWFVSAGFATYLGLANYLPETFGSARGFLVQRGISLQQIFAIRAIVNIAVYLVAMLVPIGVVAIYLSVIGPWDAPVSPAQVVPSIVAVLYCFSFYFGAVAVACRPCRWYGSRLFPLVAATAASASSAPILSLSNPWAVYVLVMPLGLLGMLLLVIASRHAFLRGPSHPAPSRTWTVSICENATLVVAIVTVTVIGGSFVDSHFSVLNPSRSSVRYTKQGIPWLVETKYHNVNGYGKQSDEVKFELSDASQQPTAKPALSDLSLGIGINGPLFFYNRNHWDMDYVGWVESSGGESLTILRYRGLLYVYNTRLAAVIGKDSVGELRNVQTPFDDIPSLLFQVPYTDRTTNVATSNQEASANAMDSFAIVASDGIYQVNLATAKIELLLETKVRMHAFVDGNQIAKDGENEQPNQIVISDGDSISVYTALGRATNGKLSHPELAATLEAPKEMATHLENGTMTLFFGGADNWTLALAKTDRNGISEFDIARSSQNETKRFTTKIADSISESQRQAFKRQEIMPSLFVPPSCMAIFAIASQWDSTMKYGVFQYAWLVVAQALLSGILATLAARRRGLTGRQCAAWCLVGLLIGVGTWIAVLCAYPRVVYSICPSCNRNRRLDHEHCESCNAIWEPPAPLGIELIQRDEPSPVSLESAAI